MLNLLQLSLHIGPPGGGVGVGVSAHSISSPLLVCAPYCNLLVSFDYQL
jgi:hypothetical protein